MTQSEIFEQSKLLKLFIDKHNISIYEKKSNHLIRKIFDLWDNNNTVGVIIFKNNCIKIDGEYSILKDAVIDIFSNIKTNH